MADAKYQDSEQFLPEYERSFMLAIKKLTYKAKDPQTP
jgi:hypothetical protein